LIATTAAFLALADPLSLGVLVAMTALVLFASRAEGANRGPWTIGAMAAIVAVLFAFKAVDPARGLFGTGGLVIPLGLSFYALRCLHVLVERYLDEIAPPQPRQLLAYLFFLPTIVAGPVHRYPGFTAQAETPLDWRRVSAALERILYGDAKIVVISNYLLNAKLFAMLKPQFAESSAAYQYLDCLHFGLNLYFQFSGYSDIAIGVALLLNKVVMENFDFPFVRTNLVDFWRSWHMSVTSWCREYIFAGVYALTRQRSLGMLATMLAIGLWHGVTLNFVAWGLYHGLGIVASQFWAAAVLRRRRLVGVASLLVSLGGWFVTFNFVIIGFAWTKEPDLASALEVFRTFLRGAGV
jgi:alginate O-acetyltransferase complex protein AlgI